MVAIVVGSLQYALVGLLLVLAIVLTLVARRRRGATAAAEPAEPVDLRRLDAWAPSPEAEAAEQEPVPGLDAEPDRVPTAVRDLPRADELPEWFVLLRGGEPRGR